MGVCTVRTNADKFNTLMLIGCVLIYLTIAAAVNGVFGATRYVSTAGSNTSPYTSWATAATHPNRINAVISTGDTVRIAPAIYDTVCIVPPRGGTVWTVYCDSLAAGTQRSATILSSGRGLTAGWTSRGGNVYRYNATIPVGSRDWYGDGQMTCTQNHVVMFSERGSVADLNANGECFYNTSTDSLFVYDNTGAPSSGEIRYSQYPVVNFDYSDQDMIIFDGLTLDLGIQGVIVLASANSSDSDGPDSIVVRNCNIQNSGSTSPASNPALIYSGNPGIASEGDLGRFFTAINDTFRNCRADDAVDEHNGNGIGFYVQEEVLCSANVFLNIDGICINFKNGYANAIDIDNSLLLNNKFVGGAYGIRLAAHNDSVVVAGNQFINQTYRGLMLSSSSGTPQAYSRIKVFNNTFYNIPYPIIVSPTAAGANEIRYNVIFDTTSRTASIALDVQGGEAPAQSPATDTYFEIDSNLYYHGGDGFAPDVDADMECDAANWTQWQACGFDVNGLTTNPNFGASETPTLTRPGAAAEMNRTYGGKTWTIWGAVQPDEGEPSPGGEGQTRARVRMR